MKKRVNPAKKKSNKPQSKPKGNPRGNPLEAEALLFLESIFGLTPTKAMRKEAKKNFKEMTDRETIELVKGADGVYR